MATLPAASELAAGVMEIATSAEVLTGTDNTRAVSPAGLAAKVSDVVVAASTTAAGVVELATDAETQTGTDADRAVTPAGLQSKTASATAVGIVELATDAETQTGSDSIRAVTPAGLQAKTASTTALGIVELATDAETQTGSDSTRVVTPAGLQSKTASSTAIGLVELATDAETQTGTDATRAVTPAGLAATTATTTRAGVVELATDAESLTGTDDTRSVTPAALAYVIGTLPGISDYYTSNNLLENPSFEVCSQCDRSYGATLISGDDWTGATGATPPTGWTVDDAGTFTIDGGGLVGDCLKLTLTGTTVSIYVDVAVEHLATYALDFYVKAGDADDIKMYITNTSDTATYGYEGIATEASWTRITHYFVNDQNLTTVRLRILVTGTVGEYMYIDSASFKKYELTTQTPYYAIDYWGYSGSGTVTVTHPTDAPLALGSAKMVSSSGVYKMTWPATYTGIEHGLVSGRSMSFGGYIKTSDANSARVCINNDGDTTCSSYVTADGDYYWTAVTVQMEAAPSTASFYFEVGDGDTAYINAPVLVSGGNALPRSYDTYNKVLTGSTYANASGFTTTGVSLRNAYRSLFDVTNGLFGPMAKGALLEYKLTCGAGGACTATLGGATLYCPVSSSCNGQKMVTGGSLIIKDANVSAITSDTKVIYMR